MFVPAALLLLSTVQVAPACGDRLQGALHPSRDLYCIELAPAGAAADVRATLELTYPPGPFTLPVTADGRVRYRPILSAAGLRAGATLGGDSTYVAWVAPPMMYPVERLGTVTNGRNDLREIALDKFVVLVSLEPTATGERRRGPLVLRGASPSSRMRPPDFLEFGLGAAPPDEPAHGDHEHGAPADPNRWTGVPMPEGVAMLPSLMRLRPRVGAWLPRDHGDIPDAEPRRLIRLGDGDTLVLDARPVRRTIHGRTYIMYGFNGQYPGPLLHVPQGATVVVEFTNRIEWPTTIHWHGLRLDNRFDGVPDVTQAPVQPGGTFTYHVHFPDAGIYWYHPHVREDLQQDLGLYGNMRVRSRHDDWYGPAHREEVLMLDDLLIGEDGLVPYGDSVATHAMMGRFGNVMLVNGEPGISLDARPGEVIRLFLTNVANTRTFNLSIPGAAMKVVGSDVGNFVRESWVESVVIAPAERYVVDVRFDAAGHYPLVNRVRALDHLYGRFFGATDTLGVVTVAGTPATPDLGTSFEQLRHDRRAAAEIDAYRTHFGRPVDHELVLTLETRALPFVVERLMQLDSAYFHPVEWAGTMPMMNWASTIRQMRWILRDPETGRENMAVDDWRFRVGDIVKLRIANERQSIHAMPHPIHIHGQRFLVLAINGEPNPHLVWKDTVLLPVGATADLLLELSNPGSWMLHCHIAEHIEAGMMMLFEVTEQ